MMTIGHELAKWRHLVAKLGTYSSGAPWWPKLKLMQVLVAKFATNKVTLVIPLAMFSLPPLTPWISRMPCTFFQPKIWHPSLKEASQNPSGGLRPLRGGGGTPLIP